LALKIARVAFALVLLAALFYFNLIDLGALGRLLTRPGVLIFAFLLSLTIIVLAGLRWRILLSSQGLVLPCRQVLRIVAIGAFFNNFLPGSAGGDVVRGVFVYQASEGRRTGGLLSILIDRLIGLGAFIAFGVLGSLMRPWRDDGILEYTTFVLAAAFLAGMIVLFRFGHPIAQLVNLVFGRRSRRLASVIDEAGAALRRYAGQWGSLLLSTAVSMAIVLLFAICISAIASGIEPRGLSALDYGIAGVYATIANALPFSPGGLGVGEGAFASACAALEPAASGHAYGTIFLAYRCIVVMSTLPGLALYLVSPRNAAARSSINGNGRSLRS